MSTNAHLSRAIAQYQKELAETNGVTALLAEQKQHMEAQVKTIANIFRNGLFSFLEGGFKNMVKSFENALSAMAADLATSEISRFLFGSMANST